MRPRHSSISVAPSPTDGATAMRMIRDPKGRFPERPYYTNDELDRECERLVRDLHRKRNQEARPRITTDELHLLIELKAASQASSADLTARPAARRVGKDGAGKLST